MGDKLQYFQISSTQLKRFNIFNYLRLTYKSII